MTWEHKFYISLQNDYSKERNFSIITSALEKLGIKAEAAGRNDILLERKVSGSAFKLSFDRAFHHGTFLINTDMTRLSDYLTPNPKNSVQKGLNL